MNIFKRDLLNQLGPQIEKDPKNQDLRSKMELLKEELRLLTQSYESPKKHDLTPDEAELIKALQSNELARKELGKQIKAAVKAKDVETIVRLKKTGQVLAQEHKELKKATEELYDSLDAQPF